MTSTRRVPVSIPEVEQMNSAGTDSGNLIGDSRRPEPSWRNVPNQITSSRFVLSLVVFALIGWEWYLPALIAFVVAAATDWIDGYWARKYGLVTKLGRILDPFVDKFIICGVFIYLASKADSGITAWMAVLVVARELLVTAIRAHVEGEGGDFSANQAGKWKMVFQCIAAGVSLLTLYLADQAAAWVLWTRFAAVWLAILTTIYSGAIYVGAAIRIMRNRSQW
jgi:CDP-diacylglycerol---glycerol-3-phosphate 3-phosphatidyltransferase